MNKKTIITALLALVALAGRGQTDTKGGILSGMETDVQPFDFNKPMMVDSLRFHQKSVSPGLLQDIQQKMLTYDRTTSFPMPVMPADKPFKLWNGASLIVYGATNQMPGLMDLQIGSLALHQSIGSLHLSASTIVNKYWMPMQGNLVTQYGLGGTIGYDVNKAISLHVFGYYYANNPLVGPAFSPYVSTTSFGGYANIRFSENFGSEVGVRRYVNPMSGRWTTLPIVTPYFRVGKRNKVEIGLPLGELLKAAIWGNNDNPLRYRPQPQPQPKKK